MSRLSFRRTTQRLINDPSFAFGRIYEPFDVVESNIVLLQARLSTLPKAELTIAYLESEYTTLLDRLENAGDTVVTAYARPIMPMEVWLACQLSRIEKFREDVF
ncbi:MAG: hypothetical protein OXE05_01985 [Chloroflexi bacterium]|nr:hypothetical protein [Chloroflexota bacterium]